VSNPVARSKLTSPTGADGRQPAWQRTATFDVAVQAATFRAEYLRSRAEREPQNSARLLVEALHALDQARAQLAVARDELHEQADQLLAARLERELEWARYRDLFEAAPLPYLETDLRGIVIEGNRSLCDLLRVRPAELIAKPILVYIGQPDRRACRDTLEALSLGATKTSILVNLRPRGLSTPVPTWLDMAAVAPWADSTVTVRWMFSTPRAYASAAPAEQLMDARLPPLAASAASGPTNASATPSRAPRARCSSRWERRTRLSTRERLRTRK
jgi:PAS domain-containing protein